ncbi:MAG: sulfatase-like hydrolase/transferase [Verrucomicrobiota bacterium]|jgi:arylsulfatase A|nr:sulfatase-like hydrolase/transferase [Verrucomicrobiota bacterium]
MKSKTVAMVCAFGFTALAGLGRAAERPNIVLILADDFGYECIGANGGTSYPTPNIDRLAANGMRFENCFVQPLCTPTRVQLMTGLSNIRNYTVFGRLDSSQKTFGNLFRDAGYATGIFGKWQLGSEKELPKHFGFDTYVLWQHLRRPPRYANPGVDIQDEPVDYANGEYGPEIFADHAVAFIEKNKNRPFFLYYPMVLAHSPFQPSPDSPAWDKKLTGEKLSNPKHFKSMTEYLDKNVGRIVKKLEETGLSEKTLVIFLGDNGTGREITSQFKGAPYRGGKGFTNESGMHVPFIASFPGKIKPGAVNTNLVDSTDFLPTIAEAAGIALTKGVPYDGFSFYPQLLGRTATPREWIYSWYLGQKAPGNEEVFAFDHGLKLYKQGTVFNVADDPLEKAPLNRDTLTDAQKATLEKLQAVLDRYKDARPGWIKNAEPRVKKPAGNDAH